MSTYIALLRGLNVSGHKLIRMADLRAHFTSAGAVKVRTARGPRKFRRNSERC